MTLDLFRLQHLPALECVPGAEHVRLGDHRNKRSSRHRGAGYTDAAGEGTANVRGRARNSH